MLSATLSPTQKEMGDATSLPLRRKKRHLNSSEPLNGL